MIMKQSSKYIDIIQWAGINYIFQRSINNLKVIPKKTSGSESGGPFGPIPWYIGWRRWPSSPENAVVRLGAFAWKT